MSLWPRRDSVLQRPRFGLRSSQQVRQHREPAARRSCQIAPRHRIPCRCRCRPSGARCPPPRHRADRRKVAADQHPGSQLRDPRVDRYQAARNLLTYGCLQRKRTDDTNLPGELLQAARGQHRSFGRSVPGQRRNCRHQPATRDRRGAAKIRPGGACRPVVTARGLRPNRAAACPKQAAFARRIAQAMR